MIFIIAVSAYLLGSVSFALIAGFLFAKMDIRTAGSGNAGATNVFRILGWKAAVPVLLGDFFKGFLPVYFTPFLLSLLPVVSLPLIYIQVIILVFLVLGHTFPLWFGFRGGKGVATAAGGIAALFPPALPFCLAVFAAVLLSTRYVSLASLSAAWFLPLFFTFFSFAADQVFSFFKLITFIVIATGITVLHRANIKRLLRGEEKKISLRF